MEGPCNFCSAPNHMVTECLFIKHNKPPCQSLVLNGSCKSDDCIFSHDTKFVATHGRNIEKRPYVPGGEWILKQNTDVVCAFCDHVLAEAEATTTVRSSPNTPEIKIHADWASGISIMRNHLPDRRNVFAGYCDSCHTKVAMYRPKSKKITWEILLVHAWNTDVAYLRPVGGAAEDTLDFNDLAPYTRGAAHREELGDSESFDATETQWPALPSHAMSRTETWVHVGGSPPKREDVPPGLAPISQITSPTPFDTGFNTPPAETPRPATVTSPRILPQENPFETFAMPTPARTQNDKILSSLTTTLSNVMDNMTILANRVAALENVSPILYCYKCKTNPRTHACFPCGHRTLCESCVNDVVEIRKKGPPLYSDCLKCKLKCSHIIHIEE